MRAQSPIRPIVRLPSPAGLNPNMARLLDYPCRALARGSSPAGLAVVCEGISNGLLMASANAPEGDLVGAEDLAAAAQWFAAVSSACRRANH